MFTLVTFKSRSHKFKVEEYSEYYWLDGEVPEEQVELMFDWMFEQAQMLYEDDEECIRIIRSN